jgi:hypothetical protein
MKKMKNYFMSSLAIVGAISLIIMACSADNSNNTNSTNSVSKYQISSGAAGNFDVINTETGVVKSYVRLGTSTTYSLITTTVTQ